MPATDALILQTLRSAGVHLPSSELAAHVGLALGECEARVEALRGAGFDIESKPGFGYRFIAAPDRIIADDLQARLGASSFVRDICVFEETGSTNDVAAGAGRSGAAGGLVVFAERQISGRGRFGRRWESAGHLGLWFSVLYRPDLPLNLWPRLTTWVAVAIARAVQETAGVELRIKWPNDCFFAGRKLGGILVETGQDQFQQSFAVLGIGLNVNHEADDFPPELIEQATSLRIASGQALDRSALGVAILRQLERTEPALQDRFDELVREATERSSLLGTWIRVHAGDSVLEGIAEGLDAEGRLLLRLSDGECRPLSAGEVTTHG